MKKNKEYYLHYAKPEEVKELTLIHYGAKKYDPEKFHPIVNDWVKPKGGLWTSPVNSTDGWKDWCNAEDFRRCSKRNSFSLKLKEWALILKIESMSHLEAIPVFHPYKDLVDKSETFRYMAYPDFEALVGLGIHAIWLTAEGQ